MTRAQLDKVFLEHYDSLIRTCQRKIGNDAPDVVHTTYEHIVGNSTFKQGPTKYAYRWLCFKVAREVARYRKAKRLRTQKTWEAKDTLIGAMQEREGLERPDVGIMVKELQPRVEKCG